MVETPFHYLEISWKIRAQPEPRAERVEREGGVHPHTNNFGIREGCRRDFRCRKPISQPRFVQNCNKMCRLGQTAIRFRRSQLRHNTFKSLSAESQSQFPGHIPESQQANKTQMSHHSSVNLYTTQRFPLQFPINSQTGYSQKNVPVRLLGTSFTTGISCFKPGPQETYRTL
jgi:hypothetical protein